MIYVIPSIHAKLNLMKIKILLLTLLLCGALNTAFASIPNNKQEPTIIELLQDGENYTIEITSIGCFNGTRQTLTVFKEAGIVTAGFQDSSKVLSEKDIEALIAFEVQLRALKIGGCSTVDTYVLRYGNGKFKTSDGTCNWNGGKKLLQLLGYV